MRRNWIQFNTRGPRACRQARCLLLAQLASLSFVRSVLAPALCVCCVLCVCVCVHPEKLEPLLESGHDLAVTHRASERAERRQQQQPRLCKTSGSLTSLCRSLEAGLLAGLLAVCHSFYRDCLLFRLGMAQCRTLPEPGSPAAYSK